MKINRISQANFKSLMEQQNITDQTVDSSNDFYICLNSTGWIHSIPYFKEEHANVINLYFDDVESSGPKEIQWFGGETKIIDAIAMNERQAEQLVRFISTIPSDATLYVYCAKGKSRSRAVEDFILSIETNIDTISEGSNQHVYKSLREAYARL